MYDVDGAFHSLYPGSSQHIDIRYCNLELWPGSPNMAVVDYLIENGVRVYYEEGNQMVDAVPLSNIEVPDVWLRTVIENGVGGGKQFATDSNPACGQIP